MIIKTYLYDCCLYLVILNFNIKITTNIICINLVTYYSVEDHDDLTPIFNRHSDMLKMTYGGYFLAELIEAQDEHMQCLVAEV